MSTAKGTWKAAERRVAAFFGTRRKPGSGSWGRDDETSSDTKHEHLYIEVKLRERHAAWTLFAAARALARKEGKLPVVALAEKGKPGFLLVVHCDDFAAVARHLGPPGGDAAPTTD